MASGEGLAVMAAARNLRLYEVKVFLLGMLWIKNVNLSYLCASPSIAAPAVKSPLRAICSTTPDED
jgi:hypothetical protein